MTVGSDLDLDREGEVCRGVKHILPTVADGDLLPRSERLLWYHRC